MWVSAEVIFHKDEIILLLTIEAIVLIINSFEQIMN